MKTRLNIAFIGARRCGKSSTLASMIHSLDYVNSNIRVKYLDEATETKMREKNADLRRVFTYKNDGFWIDDERGSDSDFNMYNFLIQVKQNLQIRLQCIDIPGEKIEQDMSIIERLLRKTNVIVVAIDTPQLYENAYLGKVYNCISNIRDVIINATIEEQNCNKRLLFVPIKCEKYVHSKQMELVSEAIKNAYSDLINYWKEKSTDAAFIVPVQTLGDLEFDHFQSLNGNITAQYKFVGNKNYAPNWCEQPIIYAIKYALEQIQWNNVVPLYKRMTHEITRIINE